MSTGQTKKRIEAIRLVYGEIAGRIEERLRVFKEIWEKGDDSTLFIELVFCILTPQSGARRCWQAVDTLVRKGCLFNGTFDDICPELNIVRFKNNKTSYILEARNMLMGQGKSLRKILRGFDDVFELREWIVMNVKGIGYKEASHYLRNIGLGDYIAILDRHILRSMHSLGLISEIPGAISPSLYFEIEKKLKKFSSRVKIPLGHLDYVLWYSETGDIFK